MRAMSLRRSVLQERQKKKSSQGWSGSWRDRFDVPKADAEDILLAPGLYEDDRPDSIKENGGEAPMKHYHVHPSHTYKDRDLFRMGRCAGGWEGHDGDCLGCYRKESGDKRVGHPRAIHSLNLLHLALYRKETLKDKSGKPRRFEHDDPEGRHKRGDPIRGWVPVTRARDIKEVKQNLGELLEEGEASMFRKKYVEVGSSHLQNLMAIDDMAKKHCFCGGQTTPSQFNCAKCDSVLLDVEEANLTPEERDEFAIQRQRCDACGHYDFPDMDYVCDDCDDPQPLNAFQVVASVRKAGEGTSSTIYIDKITPIYEYELPDGSSLLEWDKEEDDFAIDKDGNFVFREDVAKLVNNQFNFDKVHQPFDNDYIAQFLKCDNPFEKKQGARQYRRRNDDDGDDDDNDTEEKETIVRRRRPRRRSHAN